MEVDNDIGINKIGIDIDGATPVSQYTLVSVGVEDDYIGYTYDSVADTWAETTVSIDTLRGVRDELLSSSDFTQLPDVHDATVKDTWATYRQELRDFPNGYTPLPGSDIIWPVKPE